MKNKIFYFPISFFAMVLGLTGFTLALHKTEQILSWSFHFSFDFLILSLIIFIIVTCFYLLKIIFFPKEVKNDFIDPVKMNFFPLFSICLLLFSIIFLEKNIYGVNYSQLKQASFRIT